MFFNNLESWLVNLIERLILKMFLFFEWKRVLKTTHIQVPCIESGGRPMINIFLIGLLNVKLGWLNIPDLLGLYG